MNTCGFFATAGRGTEKFVEKEIVEKFKTVGEVCRIDGKVFFSLDAAEVNIDELLNLKSVERLFIRLLKEEIIKCNGDVVSFLKGFIDKNIRELESCFKFLKLFRVEHRGNFAKDVRKRGETYLLDTTETYEMEPAQKIRRCENGLPVDLRKHRSEIGTESENRLKLCKKSNREDCTESSQRTSSEDIENNRDTARIACRNCKTESQPALTFRVSCKCRGKYKNGSIQSEIITILGKRLSELWQLEVDLRNPSFELFVHINDSVIVIGLPVTQTPLSKRPYLKTIGLRSSVAWIIVYLSSIERDLVVVDPMCGAATLLVEAAMSWPDAVYIGFDNDKKQLEIAQENIKSMQSWVSNFAHVQLIEADATNLEFLCSKADRIICDIPFGKKFGRKEEMQTLYPRLVASWDSILRPGGKVVILCGHDSVELVMRCVREMVAETTCHESTDSSTPRFIMKQTEKPFGENKCQIFDHLECSHEGMLKLPKTRKWRDITVENVSLGVTQACICVFEKVL